MKKFSGSIVVGLLLSSFAIAGGDIAPVEPAVVMPAPMVDDSGFYVGVAYSRANMTGDYLITDVQNYESVGTNEIDYDGIMAQAGYKFNKYIALEGRYWWSLSDGDWSDKGKLYDIGDPDNPWDTWNDSGNKGDDLRAWGIYVKPMYPVTEQLDVYALLGYGNVRLSDDGGKWLDESDFQWGIGASYEFTENLSLFVDYVRLLDENNHFHIDGYSYHDVIEDWDFNYDNKVYTINVGLTYKF
ncbi:MAG: outer membrane protein [Sulfurovaceae bacterium]